MRRLVGLAWFVLAAATFARVAPHAGHAGGAHSDLAIPQMMANARSFSPYDLYYWGQDRFGGWPFLIPAFLRRLAHVGWTTDGLFWWMAVVLAISVPALNRLAGAARWLLPAGLGVALTLDGGVRPTWLDVSQPYAWQFPALMWGWWAIARLGELAPESPASFLRQPWRTPVLGASAAAFVAIWTSTLSAPLLCIVALIELLRAQARDTARRAVVLGLPIVIGVLGELFVRQVYAEGVTVQHLWWQHTPLEIDVGSLATNFAIEGHLLLSTRWWVTIPLAVVVSALALRVREDGARRRAATTALVFTAMAAANFVAVCLLSWTRINHYNPHYLASVQLFGVLGVIAGAAALVPVCPRLTDGLSIAAVAVALVLATPSPADAELAAVDRVSRTLAQRAPGMPLLGSYWGTYLFVDASVENPVVPYTQAGDFTRTPWTYDGLLTSDRVIVSLNRTTHFGKPGDPPPFLEERGVLLELIDPRWLQDGPFSFALYRNDSQHLLAPVRISASGRTLDSEQMGEGNDLPLPPPSEGAVAFEVSFPPCRDGRLVVFLGSAKSPPSGLPAFRVESGSPTWLNIESHAPAIIVTFKETGDEPVDALRFVYGGSGAGDAQVVRSAWLPAVR